jgi:hyperosmotically inducible protein
MRAGRMTIIGALGLVLAVSGGASAQKRRPEMGRNAPASRATEAVSREVRHELLKLPYYNVFDWLQYQIAPDGTVVLDGAVTRPTTKSSAERVVQKVEGVSRVDNRVRVLSLSPSDDRLRRALYRAVYSGPLFRYQVGSLDAIHIVVDRGHVTLLGQVSSSGDRTIAGVRANQVPGVFSVDNRIEVEGGGDR